MSARRSERFRIHDMLQAIERVTVLLQDVGLEQYRSEWILKLAAERSLEIISEASRHLSQPLKDSEPEIPWRRIADLGNVIRHAYDKVEDEFLYLTVQHQLFPLAEALRRILAKLDA